MKRIFLSSALLCAVILPLFAHAAAGAAKAEAEKLPGTVIEFGGVVDRIFSGDGGRYYAFHVKDSEKIGLRKGTISVTAGSCPRQMDPS